MTRLCTKVLLVAVALLVGVSFAMAAEDGGKKKGKRGPGPMDPFRAVQRLDDLTADQKAKIEDVKKEFGEKLAAAAKKAALNDEQRKAGRDAATKARDEGKSREDIRKAAEEAQKLTDDQKSGRKEAGEILGKIRTKLNEILTDAQKAKLRERFGKGKGKKTT